MTISGQKTWIKGIAKVGLTAKGVVYLILGTLAFMAAFELGGQTSSDTTSSGVLTSVKDWPAGMFLLILLAIGLVCYTAWRFIHAFTLQEDDDKKRWIKRIRYIASGIAYLSLALSAIQLIFHNEQDNGDKNQYWAAEVLSKPFGQWLLGIGALVMAATGIYQVWYGLSEHYKKHVQKQSLQSNITVTLSRAGKIGYAARGIVWLLVAYLLLRAALDSNPNKAGDTGKAFQFLEEWSAGSFLLGGLGLGLVAYGIFNFVRARYEREW